MDIDEALEQVGSWGRYQKRLYVIIFVTCIPNAFTSLHVIFSHYEPDYHCRLPDELNDFRTNDTEKYGALLDFVLPKELDQDGLMKRSKCQMYNRNYSAYAVEDWPKFFNHSDEIVGCSNGYTFRLEPNQNSAVVEYEMICTDDWKTPLATTIYQLGLGLGSTGAALGDRFGRRPIFLLACAAQCLSLIFMAISWDYSSYLASNFIQGGSNMVNYVIAFVLVTEMIDKKWRNFVAVVTMYSYSVGYCMFAALGYLFQDWRSYFWAISVITAAIYIPGYWLFPESARWLTEQGRREEAVNELRKVAKMNQTHDRFQTSLEKKGGQVISKNDMPSPGVIESLRVLFKSGIAGRFLSVNYGWLVVSMGYFVMSYYSTSFSEDRFLNVLYAGLAEFPAYLVSFYAVQTIGRPRSNFLFLLLAGLSSITLPYVPEHLSAVRTTLSMLGKGAVSASYYVVYLMASEVVPTLQRSASMSMCGVCARIGSLVIPFLSYASLAIPFLPNLIVGVFAITAGIISILFVPETKGVPMPDTSEEARNNKGFYGFNVFKKLAKYEKTIYTVGQKSQCTDEVAL